MGARVVLPTPFPVGPVNVWVLRGDPLTLVDAGPRTPDALTALEKVYAGSLGYEFEHLDDHVKVDWLWDQVETGAHRPTLAPDAQKKLLRRLLETEGLEQFLHRAYLGQKRFSLEGTDALVPMLDVIIEQVARNGAREVVVGELPAPVPAQRGPGGR